MGIEKDSNREAFEEWYCKNHTALKQSDLAKFRTPSGYSFGDSLKINVSWEAWQAAKEHEANKLGQETLTHERLQELITIGVKAALDEREQK